jgi:hypothetical protein
MARCKQVHERRTTVFTMFDTRKPTPTLARLAGSGRAANPGPMLPVPRAILGVGRGVSVDTWYRRPASIAA